MAETHFNIRIQQEEESGYYPYFNLSQYIDKDSVSFSYEPRRLQVVRTEDGFDHVAGEGKRLSIRFAFNPLPHTTALTIIGKLLETPTLTIYFEYGTVLQPDAGMYYMRLAGGISTEYLAKCEYRGQDWYKIGEVELVEL